MSRFFRLQAKNRRLQIYTMLRAISRLLSAIMQYRSKLNAKTRTQTLYQYLSPLVAEKPGFEPGRHSTHPTPLAGEPLRPLGYFSICIWRRERDSNPRCLSTSLVFKTSAINHSAISPCKPANMIISDAEEVVNIYALFFCRNGQSFLGMVLPEGKVPLPHR